MTDNGPERMEPPEGSEPEGPDYQELWHFTCSHGRRAIGKRGLLIPQIRHPLLGVRVIWLTTEAAPDRQATGLGMTYTTCDRMEYRYRVLQPERCLRWLASPFRVVSPADAVTDLEMYGDPEHWWVTAVPTMAALDG